MGTASISRGNDAPQQAKVLVVDDNAVNRKVVIGILRHGGITDVDEAVDGHQAIERFRAARYDLIIMDCNMPRLDGWAASKAIRQLEAIEGTRRTPIIALTAQAGPGEREKSLASGMDDFLTKPVTSDQLTRVINQQRQASGRIPAAGGARLPADPLPQTRPTTRILADGQALPRPPANPVATARIVAPQVLPILDPAIVESLRGYGDEAMRDIYGSLVEDLPRRGAQLHAAVRDGDAEAVALAAHALKGSCGSVGCRALHAACFDLEQAGRHGDLAQVAARLNDFDALAGRTLAAVREVIAASR